MKEPLPANVMDSEETLALDHTQQLGHVAFDKHICAEITIANGKPERASEPDGQTR
jgi:hypothetical protein